MTVVDESKENDLVSSDTDNSRSDSKHQHFPGLDTLRALAILIVIPWHAMAWIHNPPLRPIGRYGWMGVDLFFVLSGFLIGSQIMQTIKKEGRVNFLRFYIKRSMRILPAYWLVLLLYIIWPDFREADRFERPCRFFLFVANLPMTSKAFSHAWSLCVEEHFYLLLPIFAWWYTHRPRKINPAAILCSLFVGGMILRYALWHIYSVKGTHKWDYWNVIYYPTHTRIDGLIIGVLIGLIREFRNAIWQQLTVQPWLVLLIGIACIICGLAAFDGEKQMTASVFAFPLVSIGFGAFVISAMSPGFWLAEKRVPGAATIATAAYTIYLTHKQMISMATRIVENPDENPAMTIITAIVLILLASAILHYVVEKPGLYLRDRWLNR